MRLSRTRFTGDELIKAMKTLLTTGVSLDPGGTVAQPLFNYDEATAMDLRGKMPRCDEWGLVPAGHFGPRSNPWELEEVAESSESEEAEEPGEAEASQGASPSGGHESSARSAASGADVELVSSSSEEELPRQDPSRNLAEEEERRAREGRCELRSKAALDKKTSAARDAPCEGVGVSQGGASSHSPPPPKAKRKVWKLTDEYAFIPFLFLSDLF